VPRERRNPPAEELYARKWPIFAVTMIGLFMALIDVTIVNITIPELQRDLNANVDTVSWVLNAYNIMFAVLLVSMGRLADQFGRKRFFITGMAIFTIGSLFCALANSIDVLIGFRVVQAVGAGMLAPLALATTALIFPPQQRGLGLALMAVVANLGGAIGPPLGGILVEYASWHWIFAINVPVGLIGIVLALRIMPETYDLTAGTRVDWLGMTLLGGAIFCLTYGLVEANSYGWGSTEIVLLFMGAALLVVAFAASQRLGRWPMLTRSLVHNRQFTGASGAMVLFAVGVMGTLFLAVIAFVNLWGYSQIEAALAITPVAVLGLVVSPLVGRRADRLQPRMMAVPALACMATGLLWLGGAFTADPDYGAVLPPLILVGIGMGATFPSVNVGAMGSISGQELGLGSGIVNMSRQVGFALGVAILVAVFTGVIAQRQDDAKAQAAQVARAAGYSSARERALLDRAFATNAREGRETDFEPRDRVEARTQELARQAARDAFGVGFEVAALATFLALPLAVAMRRRPAEAHAAAAASAAA
jgi:EmrB/QacA subfamily drug resistance transporter